MIHLCIGSYATRNEPGVHFVTYDNGTWHNDHAIDGLTNPTFIDRDNDTLIVITALDNGHGAIARYTMRSDPFSCVWQDTTDIAPATLCHVAVDASRKRIFGSSYHGGVIGVASWDDGALRTLARWHHDNTSVRPEQTQSRMHCFSPFPNGRYAIACDLGGDVLLTYDLDRLIVVHTTRCAPASGPRHVAYHPYAPYAYVVHEFSSTVDAYAYDDTGALHLLQTIRCLPREYTGANACAEIAASPDGQDVYASNRGHDSLTHYRVMPDGTLSYVQCIRTLGKHPRHFAIHPDGHTVFVAHRDTNDVRACIRDTTTGHLTVHSVLTISKPVCVRVLG
jgi:6-phosphogluconolactonase